MGGLRQQLPTAVGSEPLRRFAGVAAANPRLVTGRGSSDTVPQNDIPAPGAVAWLDIAADDGRRRTGPLGMQIAALPDRRAPYRFKGARLRGTRCVWSASTVSGAELHRPARQPVPAPFDAAVHILVRAAGEGSVFDSAGGSAGVLRVYDVSDEITEPCDTTTHLYTLNVPLVALGVDAVTVREIRAHTYQVTRFQSHLLHAAVGLLLSGGDELSTPSSLVGVDRYLAALAALLLRTAVRAPLLDLAHSEQLRLRTDAIIGEQAADPTLSPASIAAQLDVSLRQLYRAFTGTESPAARIRRRRLQRAAEILTSRVGPTQVERVALECGFASAEYFSRAFRREYGLSPRGYRAAHRDAGGAGTLDSGGR